MKKKYLFLLQKKFLGIFFWEAIAVNHYQIGPGYIPGCAFQKNCKTASYILDQIVKYPTVPQYWFKLSNITKSLLSVNRLI